MSEVQNWYSREKIIQQMDYDKGEAGFFQRSNKTYKVLSDKTLFGYQAITLFDPKVS